MGLGLRCALCGSWMPAIKTKQGRPFLYCGREKYGFMLATRVGMKTFNKVAQDITESDLIPETRKWLEKKGAEEQPKE